MHAVKPQFNAKIIAIKLHSIITSSRVFAVEFVFDPTFADTVVTARTTMYENRQNADDVIGEIIKRVDDAIGKLQGRAHLTNQEIEKLGASLTVTRGQIEKLSGCMSW